MALVARFRDGNGGTDFKAWRQDIIGRFLSEHIGQPEGIEARTLTRTYFGKGADLEDELEMRHQIGLCIEMLRERGVLMVNQGGVYFIVKPGDTLAAKTDLVKFAKRQVKGQARLEERVEVSQEHYALPAGDPLAKAIKAAGQGTKLIAKHLTLPMLPKNGEHDGH